MAKPDRMPGRIFLGDKTEPAPKYVFSCRDRMDETYDRVRSARIDRFRYVKNFHPELPDARADYPDWPLRAKPISKKRN